MSEHQTKAGNQEHSHSITLDMLDNFCFHVYDQKSLSQFHTLSLSFTLSVSHSLSLDMLNNFCFHVYAQNSLFIGENVNGFSLTKYFGLSVHHKNSLYNS